MIVYFDRFAERCFSAQRTAARRYSGKFTIRDPTGIFFMLGTFALVPTVIDDVLWIVRPNTVRRSQTSAEKISSACRPAKCWDKIASDFNQISAAPAEARICGFLLNL